MFSWIIQSKFFYVLSNLLVLPAIFIPFIDLISNISFVFSFIMFFNSNVLFSFALCVLFIVKNNANYRFNVLLKVKGEELSKSDYDCVYLYAWCTLLRYFLIGFAAIQIFLIF